MAEPAAATGSEPTGWSVLRTTGTPPRPRGGHTATLVEKNLLVLGGVHHKGAGKFEYFPLEPTVLNTETLAWFTPRVAVGKPPPGRAYHTTTRVGTALFVFGGQCSKGSQGSATGLMDDMPVFDLVRLWPKPQPKPKPEPKPTLTLARCTRCTRIRCTRCTGCTLTLTRR